jgi:hypothetical protein
MLGLGPDAQAEEGEAVSSRMIARNDGPLQASPNAGTVFTHPFDARPAKLEADEGLAAKPDGIDDVDDVWVERLDRSHELWSEEVELQAGVEDERDAERADERVGG